MSKTYVIAGAGFRGFCDAMELLKTPGNKVHIIEPAPFFGGIMYSADINGFVVDKGVHVFDSVPKDLAEIVNEIMDGQTCEIDFVSESAFNGVVTEGFSLPDLASLDESTKEQIKSEILELAKQDHSKDRFDSLGDVFMGRYGKTAGTIYKNIFDKVYSISADKIEPEGMSVTSLHRLKFLDDEEMLELKNDAWLDTILAARRKNLGKIDDLVSVYPNDGQAMKGWCERAQKWLEAKGAQISLGEKILEIKDTATGVTVKTDKQTIEADNVIWSNDNTTALASALGFEDEAKNYQHGTPMVFITLMTQADKIKDITYIQNFEPEGLTFRTAALGLFSQQIKDDGTSFFTCECPVKMGSENWENAEGMISKVWDECKALGVVAEDAVMTDSHAIRIPVTFKPPMIGYRDKIAEFNAEIPKRSKRVVLRDVVPFFRREIYLDSLNIRDLLESYSHAA